MRKRLLLSSCSLLLALFVYFVPDQRFPNSADDWSYLFQARLFASGHVSSEDPLYDRAHPLQRYIGTNCVTDYDGRRFSKYPPGWPLLLAAGAFVHAEWTVAPLLGALLVFLVLLHVERRVGREWVTSAWVLLALCAFFVYTLQSFRSHTATMVCLFGAFLVYGGSPKPTAKAAESPKIGESALLFASGALVGFASLIRYVDWIPLAAWIAYDLLRRKRVAHLALFASAFVLVASGNLLYDAILSGHPLATPTALNSSVGPHDRLAISWHGFVVTGVRLGAVIYAFPPVLALLFVTRRYWRQSRFKVHAALFLMSVGLYFFYVAAIGGPGPRYLAAYFPFLVVAVVDGWRWLFAEDPQRARRLWRCALGAQVLASVVFAGIEIRRVYERTDLIRAVERLEPGPKVVLLRTAPRGETWADFTRNPAVLSSADVLYFGWGDASGLDALVERFPARRVFVYEYPGTLQPRPRPATSPRTGGPAHSS